MAQQIDNTKDSKSLDFIDAKNSNILEKLAEYHFLKDLILAASLQKEKVSIAYPAIDSFGYDLIIEHHKDSVLLNTIRVQLKAVKGKTKEWDVHKSILELESGRIILIRFKDGVPIYKLFDKTNKSKALERKPKKKKEHKCKVFENEFINITTDLLKIFK